MTQDNKKPLYTLYSTLKADNYDVPDTYESFERTLTAKGEKGTSNRLTLYNTLKADNYDVPDTYESFANTLFAPAPKPTAQAQYFKLRRGGKDFTVSTDEVNAAGGLSGWAAANPGAPVRVYMQGDNFDGHVDLSVAHDRNKKKGYKYTTVGAPIGEPQEPWKPTEQQKIAMSKQLFDTQQRTDSMLADQRERTANISEYHKNRRGTTFESVEGKPVYNQETGKMEKTYLTPTGDRTTNKAAADAISNSYHRAVAAANMSVGAQIRRTEAEIAELKAQLEGSKSRVHEEWAEDYKKNTAPLAAVLAADTYVPRQMSDKENSALRVAIRQKEEALKDLYEERDRQTGKDVGFWRGFGRTVSDARTWDFGMGDVLDTMTMLHADQYSAPNATEGEKKAGQAMMKADYDRQQVEQQFGGNASALHRYGIIAGYVPSFMLDFVLTGGGFEAINVVGKAAAKTATKLIGKEAIKEMAELGVKQYAKKYGVRGMGRMAENWAIKALGTTADDLLIRAPLMTNTIQAGKTTADIIERKLGDVVIDENGNYDFSNDKTWGSAIWQGEANSFIEDYSEMSGKYLDGVVTALAKTFGGKRISGMLARANASSYGQILATTRKQFERLGVSDYFGEVGEEYYGQLWRSMLNLDDAYTNVPVLDKQGNQVIDEAGNPVYERKNLLFTGQFHGDIWGGMALSMGLMGAGKYTISGMAYANMKHQVNKSDRKAAEIFTPEKWEPIRELIDNTTNEDMGSVAENIVGDTTLSDEERNAAMSYMEHTLNLRGYNLGAMAQSRGAEGDPTEQELSESFIDGYEASTPREMNDAQNLYELHRQRVEGLFEPDLLSQLDSNPVNGLSAMTQSGMYSQEELDAARDYVNAKTVRDGMIRRVNDDIDEQIAQSDAKIDSYVSNTTGMIQPALMGFDDRHVYVVGGNLSINPDGTIDNEASDESIVVRDAQTGKLEFTTPKSIASAGEAIDPEQEKLIAADSIRQQNAQSAADSMNGTISFNPGETVTINSGEGVADVSIVGPAIDEETGMPIDGQVVVQFADGTQTIFAKDALQQFADEANLERLNSFEQERAASRMQQRAAEAEAMRPKFALNDEISVIDKDGNHIRGSITSELDEDGKIEIYTEDPLNGYRVNRYTPEELESMIEPYNGGALTNSQNAVAPQEDAVESLDSAEKDVTLQHGNESEQNHDEQRSSDGGGMVADSAGGVEADRDRSDIRVYEEGLGASHNEYSEYSERARRDQEAERLIGIARREGHYRTRDEISALGKPHGKLSGESEVYVDEVQGKVFKVKNPYAKAPMKGNVQPEDAIYEHLVHNKYFPETRYQFEGISDDAGDVRIVLSQEYIGSVDKPTDEQIEAALAERGLLPEGKYRYGNDEISVTDVTGDNALLGEDGKVYFIDPIIDFKKPVREILSGGAETVEVNNQAQEMTEGEQTALSRIPLHPETNEPMFEDAEPGLTWDALAEDGMEVSYPYIRLKAAERELAKAQKLKNEEVEYFKHKARQKEIAVARQIYSKYREDLLIDPETRERMKAYGVDTPDEVDFVEVYGVRYWEYESETEMADAAAEEMVLSDEEYSEINRIFAETQLESELQEDSYERSGQIGVNDARGIPEGMPGGGSLLQEVQSDVSGRTSGAAQEGGPAAHDNTHDSAHGASQEASGREVGIAAGPELTPEAKPLRARIKEAEGEVDTNPTEAQKEAGNYKKGHVKVDSFDITIEQPAGSVRRGMDASGKEWETTMHNTYGYIRGTEGVDGDHIDVFLSDTPEEGDVFVIDQRNADGSFDEHKVMYGFPSEEAARQAYLSNYEPGWTGLGAITQVSKDEFKKWVQSSKRKTKPFSEYKSVVSKQEFDSQGNPIDEKGNLIVEKVESVDAITDKDFTEPYRTVGLPTVPENVSKAIGTNGRDIIIKKGIFVKNRDTHKELTPDDSREILNLALYNPNLVGANQPIKRPDYKVAIHIGEKNAVVVLDVYAGKDNVEIVGWRKIDAKGLERIKRQATREGGQFLILSPDDGSAAALSALPSDVSSEGKGSELSEDKQENSVEKRHGTAVAPLAAAKKAKELYDTAPEVDMDVKLPKSRKKFELNEVADPKAANPNMSGVYHLKEHGLAVATDSLVLVASRSMYNPEHADKMVGRKGETSDAWTAIPLEKVTKVSGEPLASVFLTQEKMDEIEKMARKLKSKEPVYVAVRFGKDVYQPVDIARLWTVARAVKAIGGKEVFLYEGGKLKATTNDGVVVMMCGSAEAVVGRLNLSGFDRDTPRMHHGASLQEGHEGRATASAGGADTARQRKVVYVAAKGLVESAGIEVEEVSDAEASEMLNRQGSRIGVSLDAERDEAYLKAVEAGDMETAQRMVDEAAQIAGYSTDSSYQGSSAFNGAAPYNGYGWSKDERQEYWESGDFEGDWTLGDHVDFMQASGDQLDFLLNHPNGYQSASATGRESISAIRQAIKRGDRKITVYRSVPSSVKEQHLRNGDWVTPSRKYAEENAALHGWGNEYRIIEETVDFDELWWDGNDINEWGYDKGDNMSYKNTANNRKLHDAVTYDDNGRVIPLSERFNEQKSDVRYLKDGAGRVYGWTVGGKVYLNRDAMGPATPVHEYTHLWDEMVKRENPELWHRGVELMKQTPVWQQVVDDPNYADIRDDEDAVASEVHSRLTGKRGAKVLSDMIEDARKEGPLAVAERVTLVERIKQWLRDMFNSLKATLSEWSKRDLEELTEEDFVNMTLRDLAEGLNPNVEMRRGEVARAVVEANPMLDDYHRGVRSRKDVMTFDEVLKDAESAWAEYGDLTYPDMDIEMLRQAKESGRIMVFSSKPIETGAFVTPSRMNAEEYAGEGEVFSKEVGVDEVAWTGEDEGQYAPALDQADSKQQPKLSASNDENESQADDDAIERANRRFNQSLMRYIKGAMSKQEYLGVGKPEGVMKVFLSDAPIVVRQRVLNKASVTKHNIELSQLQDLPAKLAEPIFVFQRDDKTLGVLTEARDRDGKNVCVAIELNRTIQDGSAFLEVNDIRSLHGRDAANIVLPIAHNNTLKYVDKEKGLAWLSSASSNYQQEIAKLDLDSAAKVVKNFENPQISSDNLATNGDADEFRDRMGHGYGAYSDAELSYLNDPISQVFGKNRFSKKRQAEYAARERKRMVARLETLVDRLHLDNVEIIEDASKLEGKRAKAKGFYNIRTNKITIVLPNNAGTIDAEQTLLHEAVAHYGLRKLFGKHFDTFLDNVYQAADEGIRKEIAEMAAKNGWDFRTATEEYMAKLAEDTDFSDRHQYNSWWTNIKRLFIDMLQYIGFEGFRDKTGVVISDNEIRYLLWRSYKNLQGVAGRRGFFSEAEDIAMQSALKVGNYAEHGIEVQYVAEPGELDLLNQEFNEQLATYLNKEQVMDYLHHSAPIAEALSNPRLETAAKIVKEFENPAIEGEELFRPGDFSPRDKVLARDTYNRICASGSYQFREAVQDSMLGLNYFIPKRHIKLSNAQIH